MTGNESVKSVPYRKHVNPGLSRRIGSKPNNDTGYQIHNMHCLELGSALITLSGRVDDVMTKITSISITQIVITLECK